MAGNASEIFGKKLRFLLAREGYSPTGCADFLSEKTGKPVKPQMVSRWGAGKVLPRDRYLGLIAEYCDVEIFELFEPGESMGSAARAVTVEEALRIICRDRGFTIKRLKT